MAKTWLVLDCNFLGHRSLHTSGELTFEGVQTGTIFGFLNQVLDLQEMFGTGDVVFAFDSKTSRRKKIFPAYKQKRHSKDLTEEERAALDEFRVQMKRLRKLLLPSLGFSNVLQVKGLEADDIIASVTQRSLGPADSAIIVTADHDLLQLVSEQVMFYNPNKRQRVTLQNFQHITGVRRPAQWTKVLEIAGCRTDEVPGVGGVGEKTAVQYINGLLKPESKKYKTIVGGGTIRELNQRLTCLPFAGTPSFTLQRSVLCREQWDRVCEELGFRSLRKRQFYPPSK